MILTCLYPGSPVPGTFGHSLQSLPVFNDLNQNFCLDHESGHAHYHAYPPPPYTDRLVAQQLASNTARREALRLDAMIAASRQGTPMLLLALISPP